MAAVTGDGYAVANLDEIGEGPGFRKIRRALGVEEFGVNAIVMPPGISSGFHYHDEQEELYFVHSGQVEIEFGDGTKHLLGPGGLARVAAATHRKVSNAGDEDACPRARPARARPEPNRASSEAAGRAPTACRVRRHARARRNRTRTGGFRRS